MRLLDPGQSWPVVDSDSLTSYSAAMEPRLSTLSGFVLSGV